ncbi:MAG: hypothetical protein ACLFV7_00210 [Phycisphaerae bacterium]
MFRLLRKVGKFVRGGAGPLQVYLACVLGTMAGMTPGLNLTIILLILLIVLLNVSLGVTLLAFVVGRILALLLAPWTFDLGYFLIHKAGLEGFIRWSGETAVVALMDLHYYCLLGGLVVAIVLGSIEGGLLARFVVYVRRVFARAGETSAVWRIVANNVFTKALLWLLFGKQKKTMAEMIEGRGRIVRHSGLVVTALLGVLIVGGAVYGSDYLLAGHLAEAMGKVNGAEVNIDESEIKLTAGRLRLRGVRVTNPDKPEYNLFEAEELTTQLSIMDLLRKRLVVSDIHVSALREGTKRDEPGEVYERVEKEEKKPEYKIKWPGDIIWDYFENPEKYHKYIRYLERLKEYLERQRQHRKEDPDKEWLEDLAENRGYFSLSARQVLQRRPIWTIRRAIIDKIAFADGDAQYRLEAYELSSHPALNEKPMRVSFGDLVFENGKTHYGVKQWVGVEFGFADEEQWHTHEVRVSEIPLGGDIRFSEKVPLKIRSAKAFLISKGRFNHEQWDSDVVARLETIDTDVRQGETVLGMAAGDARQVIGAVGNLTVAMRLTGPLARPRVAVDPKTTLTMLRSTLESLGKTHLAQLTGTALKRVGSGAAQIGEGLAGSSADLAQGLGQLVDGDVDAAGGSLAKGAGELVEGFGEALTGDGNQTTTGKGDGFLRGVGDLLSPGKDKGDKGNGRDKQNKDPNADDDPDKKKDSDSGGLLDGLLGG